MATKVQLPKYTKSNIKSYLLNIYEALSSMLYIENITNEAVFIISPIVEMKKLRPWRVSNLLKVRAKINERNIIYFLY